MGNMATATHYSEDDRNLLKVDLNPAKGGGSNQPGANLTNNSSRTAVTSQWSSSTRTLSTPQDSSSTRTASNYYNSNRNSRADKENINIQRSDSDISYSTRTAGIIRPNNNINHADDNKYDRNDSDISYGTRTAASRTASNSTRSAKIDDHDHEHNDDQNQFAIDDHFGDNPNNNSYNHIPIPILPTNRSRSSSFSAGDNSSGGMSRRNGSEGIKGSNNNSTSPDGDDSSNINNGPFNLKNIITGGAFNSNKNNLTISIDGEGDDDDDVNMKNIIPVITEEEPNANQDEDKITSVATPGSPMEESASRLSEPPTPKRNNHYQHHQNHPDNRDETGTTAAMAPTTSERNLYRSLFTKYEEFERPSEVVSISYSPNGEQLAVGDDSGTTVVYDLRTTDDNNRETMEFGRSNTGNQIREIYTFEKSSTNIYATAYSPDGRYLAVGGSDRKVAIYDLHSGVEIHTVKTEAAVWSVDFSPCGTRLAVGGQSIRPLIYDFEQEEIVHTFQEECFIMSVAFSPDGGRLGLGGEDGRAVVYDLATGDEIHSFQQQPVREQYERQVTTGSSSSSISGVTNAVNAISFSPDGGMLAVGGEDKCIVIYDLSSGHEVCSFARDSLIYSVTFSPGGGKIAVGGEDGLASIYNVSTGDEIYSFQRDSPVYAVTFSPNGRRLVLGDGDGKVFIYDLSNEDQIFSFRRGSTVMAVALSPDGRKLAIGDEDGVAVVNDLSNGNILHTFQRYSPVNGVSFSPDGEKLAVGGGDGMAGVVFDLSTEEQISSFQRESPVYAFSFSSDGSMVAIGGLDRKAEVYDLASGEIIHSFVRRDYVLSVSFSPDGKRLAVGGADRQAVIYDLESGIQLHTFQRSSSVYALTFSPDGRRLAVGDGDKQITIYDIETCRIDFSFLSYALIGALSYMTQVKESGLEDILAVASGNSVYIIPIFQYGRNVCSLPMKEIFDRDVEDSCVLDFVRSTSGSAAFKKNKEGLTLLAAASENNRHKLLADLIELLTYDPVNEEILVSAVLDSPKTDESAKIFECLQKHRHLPALKLLLRSACSYFCPSTRAHNLSAIVRELLCKFSEEMNTEMVLNVLKLGGEGCTPGFIVHHDSFLLESNNEEEGGIPVNKSKQQTSSSPHDLSIWQDECKRDDQKCIHLMTMRGLLPGLCSFESLKALLGLDSNEPWQLSVTRTSINCQWNGWAFRKFLVEQFAIFMGYLACLTVSCELSAIISQDEGIGFMMQIMQFVFAASVCVGIAYFAVVEMSQCLTLGSKRYFSNGWNIRQCLALLAASGFVVAEMMNVSRDITVYLSATALLLNWLGILYYLRVSERFAWIVYVLLRVIVGLIPFLTVIFGIILAFTFSFRSLHKQESTLDDYDDESRKFISPAISLKLIFLTGFFASFDDEIFDETYSPIFSWVLIIALLLFVAIVSLNALIALVGDIFDRISGERKAVLTRVKAEHILMLYCVMLPNRREKLEEKNKWTYKLVSLDRINETGDEDDVKKEDNDHYRKANKNDVNKMTDRMKGEMDGAETRIKTEMEGMKCEIKDMKTNIGNNMEGMKKKIEDIENKFDQILDLLTKKKR